ncbi:MAG: ferric reductase-like transmembrane domain-containing protein [Dehalococcoidia bacterium]
MLRALSVLLPGVFVSALALRLMDVGSMPWYVSRAAGLTSFAVLSTSVVLGLLLSTKNNPKWLKKPFVFEMHQFLSVLALVLVSVHVASLVFDPHGTFTPLELVLPFVGAYQRFWVGAGIIAAWLIAAITVSFWIKKRIGHRAWRMLHMGSFAGYLMALGHGVAAGSDTGLAPVYWMYVLSAASIAGLTVMRISQQRRAAQRPAHAASRLVRTAAGNTAPR